MIINQISIFLKSVLISFVLPFQLISWSLLLPKVVCGYITVETCFVVAGNEDVLYGSMGTEIVGFDIHMVSVNIRAPLTQRKWYALLTIFMLKSKRLCITLWSFFLWWIPTSETWKQSNLVCEISIYWSHSGVHGHVASWISERLHEKCSQLSLMLQLSALKLNF